jgi:hypothetical protein
MSEILPQPNTTRAALQAMRHDLDSYPVLAELGLAHCKVCGKVWKNLGSESAFESFTLEWLGIVTPTGWTFANEGELTFRLDIVQQLSVAESLVWCAEPCTGRPRDNDPGLLENSVYRLKALDLVDWRTRRLHEPEVVIRSVASWEIPPWAPMVAVSALRAQRANADLIPEATEARSLR